MTFTRLTLQRTSWLALFAMLCMVMAPAISHALAAVRGDVAWVNVCSADNGQVRGNADDGRASEGPGAHLQHALEHCPFCVLHVAVAPPPVVAGVPSVDPMHEVPALFLSAPRTLHAWRHALSRGPPRFI